MSQSGISRVELGGVEDRTVGSLERLASSLGARLVVELRWNGERLDRLLDEVHAGLVERVIAHLAGLGWAVIPEVSYSIFGERGSIDVLAYHPVERACLVVEVKSVVPDVQAMLTALDGKRRLAPRIARDRGWDVVAVGRVLVVADDRTARRRIAAHEQTFEVAFPVRGVTLRRWLRQPSGSAPSGLWFMTPTHGVGPGHGSADRRRFRIPAPRSQLVR